MEMIKGPTRQEGCFKQRHGVEKVAGPLQRMLSCGWIQAEVWDEQEGGKTKSRAGQWTPFSVSQNINSPFCPSLHSSFSFLSLTYSSAE